MDISTLSSSNYVGYYSIDGAGTQDFKLNESIMLLHNYGLRGENEAWANFDRWYSVYTDRDHMTNKQYVFMLRPDCNLLIEGGSRTGSAYTLNDTNGVSEDAFMRYLAQYHPQILYSLCAEFDMGSSVDQTKSVATNASGLGNQFLENGQTDDNGTRLTIHALMPYITGRIESIQLPDFTIADSSLVQPYTKYTMPYITSATESFSGGSFDISFRDDKNYSLHKLFYTWIYYMDAVKKNIFQAKQKYDLYNAFDYATSIYTVMVDATGENIIHWSKYTGCIPLTSPTSNLSFNRGGEADSKLSIPFRYFHHEQMNLDALVDLNYNSLGTIYMDNTGCGLEPEITGMATYDKENVFLGRNMVGRPFIKLNTSTGKLQLKWMAPEE